MFQCLEAAVIVTVEGSRLRAEACPIAECEVLRQAAFHRKVLVEWFNIATMGLALRLASDIDTFELPEGSVKLGARYARLQYAHLLIEAKDDAEDEPQDDGDILAGTYT